MTHGHLSQPANQSTKNNFHQINCLNQLNINNKYDFIVLVLSLSSSAPFVNQNKMNVNRLQCEGQ